MTAFGSSTRWGVVRPPVDIAFPSIGQRLGGFTLLARREDHPLAERWIARCDRSDSRGSQPVLLYRLTIPSARFTHPAPLDHPHVLRADAIALQESSARWCRAHYPGRWQRVFILESVMRQREHGGCRPTEAALVAQHLLSASAHAHGAGVCHGPVRLSEVLLSPAGSAMIELYALGRRLSSDCAFDEDDASREVASIARLATALVHEGTGGKQAKHLRAWCDEVEASAQNAGVEARDALDALIETMRLPA